MGDMSDMEKLSYADIFCVPELQLVLIQLTFNAIEKTIGYALYAANQKPTETKAQIFEDALIEILEIINELNCS